MMSLNAAKGMYLQVVCSPLCEPKVQTLLYTFLLLDICVVSLKRGWD